MFKKILILSVIVFIYCHTVYAISAESAIVMDADSGRVLYEKNAHTKQGIASTTKIMTALVVLENSKLNDIVTVSYNAASTEGSSMYLKQNEQLTVESLLYGLMLSSGNDAATALAEHISGNIEEFAKLMNIKAKDIGMTNSSFANPHGLDNENHYSTAYDMALLTKYAMGNKTFKEISGTKNKIVQTKSGEYKYLTNHNKLLSMYEHCIGVKTGFTKKCGRCLVSYSVKNGVKLIAITLNAPDDWNDHILLYDKYFELHKRYNIINTKDYIGSVNVENSDEKILKLYNSKAISLTLTEDEYNKITIKYEYTPTVIAPVYIGQSIGTVKVMLDNKTLASSPIISTYGIKEKTSNTYKNTLLFLANNLISLFYKSI